MKYKINQLRENCYDLLVEEAFNERFESVLAKYTDPQIDEKVNNFLEKLITKGENRYGDDFVKIFINEKTKASKKQLIYDLLYTNDFDNEVTKIIDTSDENVESFNANHKQDNSTNKENINEKNDLKVTNEENNFNKYGERVEKKIDIEEAKEEITFELLLSNLIDNCNWPEEAALKLLSDRAKDEKIRKQAKDELEKLLQNQNNLEEKELEDEPIEVQTEEENEIEEEPIEVHTKEPKPKLLQRFKEKLKDPKFKRKLIIGGVIIAVGAIAVALSPDLQQFFGDIMNNLSGGIDQLLNSNTVSGDSLQGANHVVDNVNQLNSNYAASNVNTFDTSSWNMQGMDIASNAYDAASGNTNLAANEWFSNDIQGFYDTTTGQMLNVTPEQLQNADFVKDLLTNNDNISAVFGNGEINSLNDVSGFVNGDDVVDLINQGRSR